MKTRKQPKQIAAYHHNQPAVSRQEPDNAPGPYYVSVKDGPQAALLSGPYNTHAEALALVDRASSLAKKHNSWAAFYSFGTVRCKPECDAPGVLQRFGYDLQLNERVSKN